MNTDLDEQLVDRLLEARRAEPLDAAAARIGLRR
jgi:hypothetical protein